MNPALGLVLLSLLSVAWLPVGAEAAGRVTFLRGDGAVVAESGQRRPLALEGRVIAGETVVTAGNGRVAVEFDDGTRFSLGSDSRFKVEGFADQNSRRPRLALNILRGVFRFVSGLIAQRNPQSVRLNLGTVATIGIRGTVVGGEFDGSARIVLLPPDDASRDTAIEVFNSAGSVLIDEPGFGTEVADASSAPTPPRRMRLRTVENLTRTLQNIGRVPRAPRIRR